MARTTLRMSWDSILWRPLTLMTTASLRELLMYTFTATWPAMERTATTRTVMA